MKNHCISKSETLLTSEGLFDEAAITTWISSKSSLNCSKAPQNTNSRLLSPRTSSLSSFSSCSVQRKQPQVKDVFFFWNKEKLADSVTPLYLHFSSLVNWQCGFRLGFCRFLLNPNQVENKEERRRLGETLFVVITLPCSLCGRKNQNPSLSKLGFLCLLWFVLWIDSITFWWKG